MKGEEAIYSSASMEWRTPPKIFEKLDGEFHFTLDSASTNENALCLKHLTKEENGLEVSWGGQQYFVTHRMDDR